MKKTTSLVAVIVVLSLVVVTLLFFQKGDRKAEILETSSTSTSMSSTIESSHLPLTNNEINYTKALSMMEHSDRLIADERRAHVAKAINEAIAYANTVKLMKDVQLTVDNHLSMSDEPLALGFISIIKLGGFTFDEAELKVFESDSSDVLQFLMVLKKDGEDNSYWVGNYNTYVSGLSFTSVWGYVFSEAYG
ncbi:TPA: hypothetical protein ACGOR8_001975 [Streptococcus suis]